MLPLLYSQKTEEIDCGLTDARLNRRATLVVAGSASVTRETCHSVLTGTLATRLITRPTYRAQRVTLTRCTTSNTSQSQRADLPRCRILTNSTKHCSMTTGNMYKLQKFACHYNLRKYSFCSRVVNYGIAYQMRWWRLMQSAFLRIVQISTGLTKKFFYDFNADLTGTGDLPICI